MKLCWHIVNANTGRKFSGYATQTMADHWCAYLNRHNKEKDVYKVVKK